MPESPDRSAPRWLATATAAGVPALAVGWFALAWLVIGTRPMEAFGEALGVGLGMLILVSLVGALRRQRGRDQ